MTFHLITHANERCPAYSQSPQIVIAESVSPNDADCKLISDQSSESQCDLPGKKRKKKGKDILIYTAAGVGAAVIAALFIFTGGKGYSSR
jgi:hypothetical protein